IVLTASANYQASNYAMACTASCTYTSDLLQYQLYSDSGLSLVWDPGVTVNTPNPCPCPNTPTTWGPVVLYGQILAATPGGTNDVSVGTYSDSITVTINF
ncbi:MAG TPA: spore coat protein U domain-containing protein, partial [Candidatus Baltobacteraceae bacterium]|nr:spore coat protein U domain-containing protein [Candidatus Baltobacteraceae bacterium]